MAGYAKFHILFLFFVSAMFSISLCSLLGKLRPVDTEERLTFMSRLSHPPRTSKQNNLGGLQIPGLQAGPGQGRIQPGQERKHLRGVRRLLVADGPPCLLQLWWRTHLPPAVHWGPRDGSVQRAQAGRHTSAWGAGTREDLDTCGHVDNVSDIMWRCDHGHKHHKFSISHLYQCQWKTSVLKQEAVLYIIRSRDNQYSSLYIT